MLPLLYRIFPPVGMFRFLYPMPSKAPVPAVDSRAFSAVENTMLFPSSVMNVVPLTFS